MIKVSNLTKSFDSNLILENINIAFEKSKIYGLLGTNGAGKSTLLRTISGIYKPNVGEVTLDDKNVFENTTAKREIFYIPDENIFLPRKTIDSNVSYYKTIYKNFDQNVFDKLQELFNLDIKKDIRRFSKGMKKQAILLISLSFTPKYIILDETFDGLDPLIRLKVKKFLIALVEEKELCIIVSTHSISDIEHLADEIIIVNNKSILYKKTQENENDRFLKVQICFKEETDLQSLNLNIKKATTIGSINTIVFENTYEEIEKVITPLEPIIFEVCNLTLEEIFTYEVEGF